MAHGLEAGVSFADETNPRRDVALMAAAARLDDVRASRAAREAEEAERRTVPLKGVLTTSFAMRCWVTNGSRRQTTAAIATDRGGRSGPRDGPASDH